MFISDYLYKYSCSYVKENDNFLIQNIDNVKNLNYDKMTDEYYSFYCVVQNIISRGAPTKPSEYLFSKKTLEDVQTADAVIFREQKPSWANTIKGDDKNNDFPAKIFFEELFPKYLGEYAFLQQQTLPEAYISDIIENDAFKEQQVDFYNPALKVVIEIDGSHHLEKTQQAKDQTRDKEFEAHGIKTFRITASDIKNESQNAIDVIKNIKHIAETSLYSSHSNDNKSVFYETVIRLQILILELLKLGRISFKDSEWCFNIVDTDVINITDLFEVAYEDLKIWFGWLFKLAKKQVNFPAIKFNEKEDSIKLDFSLFENYTDKNVDEHEIIFIRNLYFYDIDYYRFQNADAITYKIDANNDDDLSVLKAILLEAFSFNDFNQGQISIIINSLNRRTTLGVLPTGGGKSLCYQLSALLQPGICLVVAPIISLMMDQVRSLKDKGFAHVDYISSSRDAQTKTAVLDKLATNRCAIVLISPERFQNAAFRKSLHAINQNSNFALAIIDEVHCLSEWGHDFRPAYLALTKTISRICPEATLVGLTATASYFVLKDLKREFNIENKDVKTLGSMDRDELEFKRIRASKLSKYSALKNVIEKIEEEFDVDFKHDEDHEKAMIIFSPTVRGKSGCETITGTLKEDLGQNIDCYNGSMESKEKEDVQNRFLKKDFSVLACTKAFGMGIDKSNIRATVHYGLPQSVEAFYQEAGRAGRDREKATCYIILDYKGLPEKDFNDIFDIEVSESTRKLILEKNYAKDGKTIKSDEGDDLTTLMYFWRMQHIDEKEEVDIICNILLSLYKDNLLHFGFVKPEYENDENKDKEIPHYDQTTIEFALYKLSLLGFVSDWTISYNKLNSGVITVDYQEQTESEVKKHLLNYIHRYEPERTLIHDYEYEKESKKIRWYIKQLLRWERKEIAYNQLQSAKNMLDWCRKGSDEDFGKNLENYFKYSDVTLILDAISEDPYNYSLWFNLLFEEKNSKSVPITTVKAFDILGSLARYIESYQNNVGLNYLYCMLRFYLNSFDSSHLSRLKNALAKINTMKNRDEVLKKTFIFAKDFSLKTKDELSKNILDYCDIDPKEIFDTFGDRYSLSFAMSTINQRLGKIGEKLNGLLK